MPKMQENAGITVLLRVCRDFLTVAVISLHGSDCRRIMHNISSVDANLALTIRA